MAESARFCQAASGAGRLPLEVLWAQFQGISFLKTKRKQLKVIARSGWREVHVREQRMKIDWAKEVAHLLDTRYARADKVVLVCDNLNPHTKVAFGPATIDRERCDSRLPDPCAPVARGRFHAA